MMAILIGVETIYIYSLIKNLPFINSLITNQAIVYKRSKYHAQKTEISCSDMKLLYIISVLRAVMTER